MKKTIGETINEINRHIANLPTKTLITIENVNLGGNPEPVSDGTVKHMGITNLSVDPGASHSFIFKDPDGNIIALNESDYEIDYDKGFIIFKTSLASLGKIEAKVEYQQLNANGIVTAWDKAATEINAMFHNGALVRIDQPSGAAEKISSFSLEDAPFNQFSSVSAIYQSISDKKSYVFRQRENFIFLEQDNKDRQSNENQYYEFGMSYYASPNNILAPEIYYPFYIRGSYRIPLITTNLEEKKDQEFYLEDRIYNQLSLLTQYYILEKAFFDHGRFDATNQAFLKQRAISQQMYGINNSLFQDLQKKNIPKEVRVGDSMYVKKYFTPFE